MVFNGGGGGIYAESSSLHFYGFTRFEENLAEHQGGGMYADGLYIYFCEESSTLFEGNSAFTGVDPLLMIV